MDPLTIIASTIAAGALAALKETAGKAVKDAYEAVKSLLSRKYQGVDLKAVEQKPESAPKRASLAEDLEAVGAHKDSELLDAVKRLLEVLQSQAPAAGQAIGVDLADIQAAYLTVSGIKATGSGVVVRNARISGGVEIRDVAAGARDPEGKSNRHQE